MYQEDRSRALKRPWSLPEAKNALQQQRDEPALAVEKQEGDHADQRGKNSRQRHEPAQHRPTREVVPSEQKGQRDADHGRENDTQERDPETPPQCLSFITLFEKHPHEVQRPATRPEEPFDENEHQGIDYQPEQDDQKQSTQQLEAPAARHGVRLGNTWIPPPALRLGMTPTRSPALTERGGPVTSIDAPPSVTTVKRLEAPVKRRSVTVPFRAPGAAGMRRRASGRATISAGPVGALAVSVRSHSTPSTATRIPRS